MPATAEILFSPEFINLSIMASMGAGHFLALVLAILCLFLSGFVSGSEMAFFSLTDAQAEELYETPKGEIIKKLLAKPQELLASILISNNLVNVSIVVLTNYALGPVFSGMSEITSFILQTVILTFLILLFGEIIPKLYSSNYNKKWALLAARPLNCICNFLSPISGLLVKSGSIVKKVVVKKANEISTDELSRALEITQGASGDDKEMLEGILKFGDTTAAEIMTPRVDMTDIDSSMNFNEVMEVVIASGYSRLPVYEGNQDNIIGILYSRDMLPYIGTPDTENLDWHKLLRQAYFVPEARNLDDLLEDFRRLKLHMAIVVDEFGGTQGVVTLEDVLEEIVGDIDDEYDEPETTYKRLRDNTYMFEGRTPLTDFFRITDLDPDEYKDVTEDVETLAGMLLAIKGDFPKDKEPLVYGRCRFLILDIIDHRIAEVRVKVMPEDFSD